MLEALAFVDFPEEILFNAQPAILLPSPLITLFHGPEILVKALSLFITYISKAFREFIELTLEEIEFNAHVTSKVIKKLTEYYL